MERAAWGGWYTTVKRVSRTQSATSCSITDVDRHAPTRADIIGALRELTFRECRHHHTVHAATSDAVDATATARTSVLMTRAVHGVRWMWDTVARTTTRDAAVRTADTIYVPAHECHDTSSPSMVVGVGVVVYHRERREWVVYVRGFVALSVVQRGAMHARRTRPLDRRSDAPLHCLRDDAHCISPHTVTLHTLPAHVVDAIDNAPMPPESPRTPEAPVAPTDDDVDDVTPCHVFVFGDVGTEASTPPERVSTWLMCAATEERLALLLHHRDHVHTPGRWPLAMECIEDYERDRVAVHMLAAAFSLDARLAEWYARAERQVTLLVMRHQVRTRSERLRALRRSGFTRTQLRDAARAPDLATWVGDTVECALRAAMQRTHAHMNADHQRLFTTMDDAVSTLLSRCIEAVTGGGGGGDDDGDVNVPDPVPEIDA